MIRTTLLLIALASLPMAGCGYHRKAEIYSQDYAVAPRFASLSANIIQPKCLPCHGPSGGAPDFTTYVGVLEKVTPRDPAGSSLYSEIESGDMPVGRPMLSDDEILTIYQWIQNGAPND